MQKFDSNERLTKILRDSHCSVTVYLHWQNVKRSSKENIYLKRYNVENYSINGIWLHSSSEWETMFTDDIDMTTINVTQQINLHDKQGNAHIYIKYIHQKLINIFAVKDVRINKHYFVISMTYSKIQCTWNKKKHMLSHI